jgi:ferrochelatase
MLILCNSPQMCHPFQMMHEGGAADGGRTGLLLVNIGTPESPRPADVRRYLREFLSDPRIIDLPAPLRWMLVNLLILPFRPRRSAAAYRRIWTDQGSPLLLHGRELARKVQQRLGEGVEVLLGMRYGKPSISCALGRFCDSGIRRVVCLPLYPQYSEATTGSTTEKVLSEAAKLGADLDIRFAPPFYDHPRFIEALAGIASPLINQLAPERVFFSFHGLPVRQVRAADRGAAHCLRAADCCERIDELNSDCYRAQCYATARLLADRLGLPEEQRAVCFQSRLGRTEWIGPHTAELLAGEAGRGVRRALVISPSFVADCLETLHEIGIEGVELWRANGGEELQLVPSLNADDAWADAVAAMASEQE